MVFDKVSPKLFVLYMNDLSGALLHCIAGCNEQCMNHIMYADDFCVMKVTGIAWQQLLDVCFVHRIAKRFDIQPSALTVV